MVTGSSPAPIILPNTSDDLLEVDGAPLTDEFGCFHPKYLHFGDGTIIHAAYSPDGYDGMWKIERVKAGSAEYSRNVATGSDKNYSDRVFLDGELVSVECYENLDGPTREEMVERLKDYLDWDDLNLDTLSKIWHTIKAD